MTFLYIIIQYQHTYWVCKIYKYECPTHKNLSLETFYDLFLVKWQLFMMWAILLSYLNMSFLRKLCSLYPYSALKRNILNNEWSSKFNIVNLDFLLLFSFKKSCEAPVIDIWFPSIITQVFIVTDRKDIEDL